MNTTTNEMLSSEKRPLSRLENSRFTPLPVENVNNTSYSFYRPDLSLCRALPPPFYNLHRHGYSTILIDVRAFVDVRFRGKNYSATLKEKLQYLGATVEKTFNQRVTHVIFREGKVTVYKKAKKENIPLVSPHWILACEEARRIVDHRIFPLDKMIDYGGFLPYYIPQRSKYYVTCEDRKREVDATLRSSQISSVNFQKDIQSVSLIPLPPSARSSACQEPRGILDNRLEIMEDYDNSLPYQGPQAALCTQNEVKPVNYQEDIQSVSLIPLPPSARSSACQEPRGILDNRLEIMEDYDNSLPYQGPQAALCTQNEVKPVNYQEDIQSVSLIPLPPYPRNSACQEPRGILDNRLEIMEDYDNSLPYQGPQAALCTQNEVKPVNYQEDIQSVSLIPLPPYPRNSACQEPRGILDNRLEIMEDYDNILPYQGPQAALCTQNEVTPVNYQEDIQSVSLPPSARSSACQEPRGILDNILEMMEEYDNILPYQGPQAALCTQNEVTPVNYQEDIQSVSLIPLPPYPRSSACQEPRGILDNILEMMEEYDNILPYQGPQAALCTQNEVTPVNYQEDIQSESLPPSPRSSEAQAMPAVVAPHPQRTEQMFQALKKHIMRERQKKKEEQEADAEVERQRKERELQQKQDVMTLGETREKISHLERGLAQYKDDKHQLFLQLKKVLNEDDNRRRQHVRQQESRVNSAEVPMDLYSGLTYPSVPAMSGHLSHLVMQPNYPNTLYKVPTTPHTLLLPAASLKRPRSPSPPPQVPYHHSNYNQKHPSPRLSYQKSSGYSGYYPSSAGSSSSQTSSYSSYPSSFSGVSSRSEAPPPSEQTPSAPQPSKHSIYLSQPIPRGTIAQPYMHSALEHPKMSYDEKFYPVSSLRPATHVALHGGAIPIQQPAQGSKTGGITSGYPIRPPSSAPPQHVTPGTTHGSSSPGGISSSGYHFPMSSQFPTRSTTSAPTQLLASRSHGVYVSQSPSSGRLVYSQASVPQSRYLQRD